MLRCRTALVGAGTIAFVLVTYSGARAEEGITLANVADFAALGPTSISIGALTHSAPAVDISLDLTV